VVQMVPAARGWPEPDSVSADRPTPIDYATPRARGRRPEWVVPVLLLLPLLALVGFYLFAMFMFFPGFPPPSDPPMTQPRPAYPGMSKSE
jgi:hypothetical protein